MKIVFDSHEQMEEIKKNSCPPDKWIHPITCPKTCKECWSRIECEVKEDARIIQKNS